MVISIYVDGSYEKNTGMGCGIHIVDDHKYFGYSNILHKPDHTTKLEVKGRESSNSRAEWLAMYYAVMLASQTSEDVIIYSDNEYVVKTFTDYWPSWMKNGLGKKGKAHLDLITPCCQYYDSNRNRLQIIHILREYNTIADEISKNARLTGNIGEFRSW